MNIKVEKLTGVELLRRANSFTTGRDSKMTLRQCYKAMHSNARTQLFWIEMHDIPLFCASQFVRSHVGLQFYQRTKRTDRGGLDFTKDCEDVSKELGDAYTSLEEGNGYMPLNLLAIARGIDEWPKLYDRFAETSLAGLLNAEAIINMSNKRLCNKASKETREIWIKVLARLVEVDPDLYLFCQRPCVACGLCREPKPCGYMTTENYKKERINYLKLF